MDYVEKTLKGVDIEKYGFFCKDSWEDIYDSQYITDSEGNSKELKSLVKSAGEQYSIRYQEAQAIENAYLRRKINSLEKQIEELKAQNKSGFVDASQYINDIGNDKTYCKRELLSKKK